MTFKIAKSGDISDEKAVMHNDVFILCFIVVLQLFAKLVTEPQFCK